MPSKNRVVDLRGGRGVPPPSPRDVRPREPRRSTLRERKRRQRAVVSAAVAVCALLTIYSVHLASYLSRFTFQHVTVTGASSVAPAEIQKFVENKLAQSSSGFISGRNIFVYKFDALPKDIVANFPSIKSASVRRDTGMGNGLVIALEERTPFAQWCESSSCYLLDDQGVVFTAANGIATSTLPSPYVFSGPLSTTTAVLLSAPLGEVFAGEHFAGLNDFLSRLTAAGLHPLGAKLENETDFSVPLAEGYYIKASYGEEADKLAKNLALILNADALRGKSALLEYVDLRFGNRIYYKFKGQAQTQ